MVEPKVEAAGIEPAQDSPGELVSEPSAGLRDFVTGDSDTPRVDFVTLAEEGSGWLDGLAVSHPRAFQAILELGSYRSDIRSRVYFITTHDAVKIGYTSASNGARDRLASLQTGNPLRLTLRAVVPAPVKLERDLHGIFAKERLEGEWFHLSPELAIVVDAAEDLAGTVYDLELLYAASAAEVN